MLWLGLGLGLEKGDEDRHIPVGWGVGCWDCGEGGEVG